MKNEYLKIFLSVFLLSILVFPLLTIAIRRSARGWIKQGIEGDNEKPDLHEVWETIYMYMSIGSFLTLVYMIVNKTHFEVVYTWEEYLLIFLGTAGSNGVAALMIYMKQKNAKT